MLVIRLQRVGKKHQAAFRIVLQDSRWKPKGKSLELLGFYNPHSKEKQIQAERVKFWLEKGAQPSATLHNMFVDLGVVAGSKVKVGGSKKGKGVAKKESGTRPAEAVANAIAESPVVVESSGEIPVEESTAGETDAEPEVQEELKKAVKKDDEPAAVE